jgi:GAF domain-containing protein
MARRQELVATALVEGLPAAAPAGFALFEEDGTPALVSPSLEGVDGVAALAAEALDVGPVGGRPLAAGPRRLLAYARPLQVDGRRAAAIVAVDVTERARTEAALRESERALTDALRMARMGWWVVWPQSGVAIQSPELLELIGDDLDAEEALSEAIRERGRAAVAAGDPLDFDHAVPLPDGTVRTLRVRGDLVAGRGGEGDALNGFAQDISELMRRTAQQRTVAELDRVALGDAPVETLIEHVAGAAVRTLAIRRVAVMSLDPPGRRLVMRGLAPPTDEFPRWFPAGEGSFAGYTLRLRAPVVVDDWERETRFSPRIGTSIGLRSGACVVVGGAEAPFGVLMAVADAPGRFAEEDIGFLQSLANLLAEGIDRRRAADRIAELSQARGRLVAQALDAEARARRTMSESIHDGPLQDILAANHDLWALGDAAGEARERVQDVVARLRAVMVALHPTVLAYGGLEAALRAVAAAGSFEVELDVDAAAAGGRDELLVSLVRELLADWPRGARVGIRLARRGDRIVLEVDAAAEGGIGLAISAERVAAVGGRLARDGARTRIELPASDP